MVETIPATAGWDWIGVAGTLATLAYLVVVYFWHEGLRRRRG